MIRRSHADISETKFHKEESLSVNSRTIYRGDFIKIVGEHGGRFKFHSLVTNKETGAQWIDCFEVYKGAVSASRAFRPDRIKLMPIKRGRKNVN
jgi:hypothetical protein